MFDKNNSMTQWLIAQSTALRWWIGLAQQVSQVFVRFLSSKDSLINCAGVGRLKRFGEPFQLFEFLGVLPHSLFHSLCGIMLLLFRRGNRG